MNKVMKQVLEYIANSDIDIDTVSVSNDDDGRTYISIMNYKYKLKNTAVLSGLEFNCSEYYIYVNVRLQAIIDDFNSEYEKKINKKINK